MPAVLAISVACVIVGLLPRDGAAWSLAHPSDSTAQVPGGDLAPASSTTGPVLAQVFPPSPPFYPVPPVPVPQPVVPPGYPVTPQVPGPFLPGVPVTGQPPLPQPQVPGQPPAEAAPGEEAPAGEVVPQPPVMPLPPVVPPSPSPYATFRYLNVPPGFTFLSQYPQYSPYLEQNPLAPPQRIRFNFFAGGRYEEDKDLTTHQTSVDWSGIGTAATTVNLQAPRYFITLGNVVSYRHSFTAGTNGLDGVNLAAATGYSLTPRLSLGLSDTFAYSNNLLQSTFPQQNLGLFVSSQYSTVNNLTLSGNYVLSPVSSFQLFVGNGIVNNKNSGTQTPVFTGVGFVTPQTVNLQNSTTGRVGGAFNTTLVPRIPFSINYEYDYTSYSASPRLGSHLIGMGTAYNLDSVTSLVLNGSANFRFQSPPGNSEYYSGTLRLQREVYTGIVCWVGGGGWMYDTAGQGVRRTFSYLVGCTGSTGQSAQITKNLTLDVTFSSGVQDTSQDVVNFGLVSTNTASAALRWFPTREFLATLNVSGTHSKLLETTNATPNATRGNTADSISTRLYVTYAFTTWLSAYADLNAGWNFVDRGDNSAFYRATAGLSTGFGF